MEYIARNKYTPILLSSLHCRIRLDIRISTARGLGGKRGVFPLLTHIIKYTRYYIEGAFYREIEILESKDMVTNFLFIRSFLETIKM